MKTANEDEFIEYFTTEYCRPHSAVMAARLADFVKTRQLKLFDAAAWGHAALPLAAGRACRPATAEPLPEVESPDEEVKFSFASKEKDSPRAWRAELTVPPHATALTMLMVKVFDHTKTPAAGTFSLAGIELPLVDGKAEIPFGSFLNGIKATDVALTKDGVKTPGELLFF